MALIQEGSGLLKNAIAFKLVCLLNRQGFKSAAKQHVVMRKRATDLRRNTCVLSTSEVLKDSVQQQPGRGGHLIQVNRKPELVVL